MGVGHFLLYNHQSGDDWQAVLQPYIESGLVEVIDWCDQPRIVHKPQAAAYNDGLRRLASSAKWVAFIDIDEFLVPMNHDSMIEFLEGYEEYGGVVLNWRCFGTSGIDHLEPGELLIERLTWSAEAGGCESCLVKSIVRPERTWRAIGVHHFAYRAGYFAVDTGLRRCSRCSNRSLYDQGCINHYKLRTMDWAFGEKSRRMATFFGSTYEKQLVRAKRYDELFTQEQNFVIQRYVPLLRKRCAR